MIEQFINALPQRHRENPYAVKRATNLANEYNTMLPEFREAGLSDAEISDELINYLNLLQGENLQKYLPRQDEDELFQEMLNKGIKGDLFYELNDPELNNRKVPSKYEL